MTSQGVTYATSEDPKGHAVSPVATAQAALDAYAPLEYAGKYTLKKLIGRGAYGAVYVAEDKAGTKFAVKHVCNAFISTTDARRIYREVKVMAHFAHPNVLSLVEVVPPRDPINFTHIYIVVPLMETDLHRVIASQQDLTSDHISYFVYQTLTALAHIHTAGVLHRDLKPSNLLVNADCTVAMADFGLARESDASLSAVLTEYVVTRYYRAPEVLLSGGRYTGAIDVWAVGCILGEMLLRRPLFPGENYLHQLQLIVETLGSPSEEDLAFVRAPAARAFMLRLPHSDGLPFEAIFPHVRGSVLDLLARMLTFDPSRRASVEECLAHPFLARVRAARRSINEDAAQMPKPFRLRIPGGAAALKAMSVAELKARFVQEVCHRTPTLTAISAPLEGRSMTEGKDAADAGELLSATCSTLAIEDHARLENASVVRLEAGITTSTTTTTAGLQTHSEATDAGGTMKNVPRTVTATAGSAPATEHEQLADDGSRRGDMTSPLAGKPTSSTLVNSKTSHTATDGPRRHVVRRFESHGGGVRTTRNLANSAASSSTGNGEVREEEDDDEESDHEDSWVVSSGSDEDDGDDPLPQQKRIMHGGAPKALSGPSASLTASAVKIGASAGSLHMPIVRSTTHCAPPPPPPPPPPPKAGTTTASMTKPSVTKATTASAVNAKGAASGSQPVPRRPSDKPTIVGAIVPPPPPPRPTGIAASAQSASTAARTVGHDVRAGSGAKTVPAPAAVASKAVSSGARPLPPQVGQR